MVNPKTRYTLVISSALVGAGVIAFGAGSTLPTPGSGATNAALSGNSLTGSQENASAQEVTPSTGAAPSSAANQGRAVVLSDDGAQQRIAEPAPQKLPDWMRPADGYISSTFGLRFGGAEFHYGLDIAGPIGSPIRAAAAGRIIIAGVQSGYGNLVAIDHGGGVVTYYGHNSEFIAHVGEQVQAGDVIALRGNTGQSTGPHCHFEVRVAKVRIDPLPWLRLHGVDI